MPGPHYAMTFTEIGQRLGISRKMAWLHYARAMRKIRNRPAAIRELEQTVQFRQRLESERLNSGVGVER